MSHTPRLLDIEQGNPDDEDMLSPLMETVLDDTTYSEKPSEETRSDSRTPDSQGEYNADYHDHSNNDSGRGSPGTSAGATSSAGEKQKDLNSRILSEFYKAEINKDAIQRLLDEGADPNVVCTDHKGISYASTYIQGLSRKDKLLVLSKIVGYIYEKFTLLHIATYRTLPDIVRLLLAANADPNLCDNKGRTPLDVTGVVGDVPGIQNACKFTEVLKLLIEAGGKQNTMIEDHVKRHRTPLHRAVEMEHQEAVELLLRHGAAAGCWNQDGKTPLHLCVEKKLEHILTVLMLKGPDVEDKDGVTVLRAATTNGWLDGALLALVFGADVTKKAKDGETPLHVMAEDEFGWYDERDSPNNLDIALRDEVFNKFIEVAKKIDGIDCFNEIQYTPLFSAVSRGKYEIAAKLLHEGASIIHTAEEDVNVFHVAASKGHAILLEMLLDFDKDATKTMINSLSKSQGFGPIHCAIDGGHTSCFDALCLKGADMCLGTGITRNLRYLCPKDTTPLHLAAAKDNLDIVKRIIQYYQFHGLDNIPLRKCDGNGFTPFHSAINKDSVNCIKYFVLELSENLVEPTRAEKPVSALEMIMQHVTNPTEFLEDLFDSCISYNISNEVVISYIPMMPNRRRVRILTRALRNLEEEMDVVEGLIKTGNEFNQKKLLLHPLIKSFISLKWNKMVPYYLLIALVNTFFVIGLVAFEVSVFNDKDIYGTRPSLMKSIAWGFVIYCLGILIVIQELLMNYESIQYFRQCRTWFKLGSLLPAFVVPPAITVSAADWPRHVAALALFLACLQMMNLISQFPRLGYYVVMFKKVAFNYLKILATFIFLIICFAFSLKIQFRSEYPFEGSWDSVVKTFFMMSSEFEYNNVFESKNAEKLRSSYEVSRIILLAFLVLVAIVLMNMMIGVAVDDISELKSKGHIGRLEKQAHFVRSFDRLNNNVWTWLLRFMPQRYRRRVFPAKIILAGDVVTEMPKEGYIKRTGLPKYFRDAFYSIARKNKEKKVMERNKDEQNETKKSKSNFFEDASRRLDRLEASMKEKMDDLNTKVNLLIEEMRRSSRGS